MTNCARLYGHILKVYRAASVLHLIGHLMNKKQLQKLLDYWKMSRKKRCRMSDWWSELKKTIDKAFQKGSDAPARVVSPKMYEVLESMVKDGLISGKPYSEFESEETHKEYCRRMKL